MPDNTPKTSIIPFVNRGITTRVEPKSVPPGGFQFLFNITSEQEGSVVPRRGRKLLGTMAAETDPHTAAKIVVSTGESPGTPGTNYRYVGGRDQIYRTQDYAIYSASLASGLCTDPASGISKLWTQTSYDAGEASAPVSYIAGEKKMLKETYSGFPPVPAGTLYAWGIKQAYGVVSAVSTAANSSSGISAIELSYISGATTTWVGVVVTLANSEPLADFQVITLSGVTGITITTTDGRTNINDDWDIRAGVPDASGGIINTDKMFRIFDRNGKPVTGSGVYGGGATASNIPSGGLSGGAAGSPAGSLPYSWVYTYRNDVTSNEGNPSEYMLEDSTAVNGIPLALANRNATLTLYGTDDPQIVTTAGHNTMAVYRAGGTFADGLYRFVGYATNPGLGSTVSFVDKTTDVDLALSSMLATDNDAPVTSTLPTPIITKLAGAVGPGWVTGIATTTPITKATDGTTAHLTGASFSELVIIKVVDATHFDAYLQYAHLVGDTVEIDAIAGQPCPFSVTAFDAVFLAGDPNNPHALYKSKTSKPESFPVIDALGNSGSINVGTFSNPIQAICEFRGNVICMNLQNIFEVPVFNGVMYSPNVTPAQRGLFTPRAWCIADNEIWYLGYDGIWSWNGGESVKRSDSIDAIFHGMIITAPDGNLVPPVDFTASQIQWARMEYHRKKVYFWYRNISTIFAPTWGSGSLYILGAVVQYLGQGYASLTDGNIGHPPNSSPTFWQPVPTAPVTQLVYDLSMQRWEVCYESSQIGFSAPRFLFAERDLGNLVYCRYGASGGVFSLADLLDKTSIYTSDEFVAATGALTSGNIIDWKCMTGWLDFGNEYQPKVFDEIFLDLDPQSGPGGTALQVNVYYDYFKTAADTFFIPGNVLGRTWVAIQVALQNDTVLGELSPFGRQASVVALEFLGRPTTGYRPVLYSMKFRYREVADQTAGLYYDWTDCGHAADKRFYEMTVEFDTNTWSFSGGNTSTAAIAYTLILDTMTGIAGTTYNQSIQTFTFDNPALIPVGGTPGRGLCVLPIQDGVIAKLVRLRAVSTVDSTNKPATTFFRILNVQFQHEKYPADIVPFCEPDDGGNPYLKYCNQFDIDVDTNNVAVTMQLQADGTTVESFNIQTTSQDRDRTITTNTSLVGRKWRWLIDTTQAAIVSGGGKFQVFSHSFRLQPADLGEVIHTEDWKDHGWPHDKRISQCVVEWDNTGGSSVSLKMDLLSGIDGGTVQSNVASFLLGSAGRSEKSFPLPDGLICKKTRVYPSTPLPLTFRSWSYHIEFEKFPPDIVLFTEPKDFGYPYQKLARNLILQIDTGGVDCAIDLLADANVVETFIVNTTLDDWKRFLACHTELLGRMWKLRLRPGTGGKAQLFDWSLDFLKIPAAVSLWASYEQAFGYAGWKFVKQVWLQYQSPTPICYTLMTETGSRTWTLPAHISRTPERFYIPAVLGNGFNKSRIYGAVLKTLDGKPFTFYPDASWVEWITIGADQHAGYQRALFSEMMSIPI